MWCGRSVRPGGSTNVDRTNGPVKAKFCREENTGYRGQPTESRRRQSTQVGGSQTLAARLPINDPLRDVIETGADIGRTIVSGQNLAQAAMRAAGERHISDLVAEYMAAAELWTRSKQKARVAQTPRAPTFYFATERNCTQMTEQPNKSPADSDRTTKWIRSRRCDYCRGQWGSIHRKRFTKGVGSTTWAGTSALNVAEATKEPRWRCIHAKPTTPPQEDHDRTAQPSTSASRASTARATSPTPPPSPRWASSSSRTRSRPPWTPPSPTTRRASKPSGARRSSTSPIGHAGDSMEPHDRHGRAAQAHQPRQTPQPTAALARVPPAVPEPIETHHHEATMNKQQFMDDTKELIKILGRPCPNHKDQSRHRTIPDRANRCRNDMGTKETSHTKGKTNDR
jgi:hypothetical protein